MADQGADAGRAEDAYRGVDPPAVHREPHPRAVGLQVVHALQRVEAGDRPLRLRLDGGAGEVAHLGEGAGLHRAAAPDDRDPVGQLLHLGQDVAGQQHRPSGLLGLADHVLEDDLHQRVQARGGLVEQQQLGVGGQRGDDGDLLPVALGVGPALLARVQVEPLDQLVPAAPVDAAAQPREQVDGLATAQVGPQLDVARHVGETLVRLDGTVPRVQAEHAHGAGVGPQQTEQDPQGGGLAGPVGAEEAVHLSGTDGQVESVEGAGGAERLLESGDLDGEGILCHAPEITLPSESCEVKETYKLGTMARKRGRA